MRKTRLFSIFSLVLFITVTLISAKVQAISPYCDIPACKLTYKHTHGVCGNVRCTKTKNHKHNGRIYYGHNKNDGHAYHNCGVAGCTLRKNHNHTLCNKAGCCKTKNHKHNGKIYHGHSKNDGHAYHSCGRAGCTKAGSHSHKPGKHRNSGKKHH